MDSSSSEGGVVVDEQQSQPPSPLTGGGGDVIIHDEDQTITTTTTRSSSLPVIRRSVGTSSSFIGKHRMAASISHLHHQIQIIQEELDQLETLGESSIVCKEVVSSIESVPDALLPMTKGPVDVNWDRWFQGAQGSRSRKRWI